MDSIPKFLGNYNIMDDLQGCTSCSKRQFLNKRHLYQDITYSTMKAEKGQSLQTNEFSANYTPLTHLRRWRTFINNTFARYINCILYFLILLSRLLYDFKSYKRTFLKSILLLYGLMVLVNPSTSEQVYFSPRQDTKLTDTIVPVGAHFVYKIPYSLFDCDVERLEISEGSTRSLPYWLAFSEARQELYGVASIKDTGSYDILVVAVTNSTSGTGQICAIKAFSITVSTRDTSSSQINNNYPLSSVTMETPSTRSEGSHFQCSAGTQAFFGTVLISANMHQLTGHQRMMVLASMADYLNVSSSKVALFTADNGHPMLSHLEQLSVLTSGAGDGRFKSGSKSILTWILSCGAIRLGDSYLHELENKAKDGTMSEKLGYPIVGWHVTSGVQKSKHRARRAAAATPTPQATSILPTRVMSSSTIIINETSSLSSSSSVFNNSTILPQTTSYVTPTSSVLPSSSTLEHSWSVSSMIATSPVSNITSTPILTTFIPTITVQPVSSTVAMNSSSATNLTASVSTLSSSMSTSTVKQESSTVAMNSSNIVNQTASVSTLLSLMSSSTVKPESSTIAMNSSNIVISTESVATLSSSMSTTTMQPVPSTVETNSSSYIYSTTSVSSFSSLMQTTAVQPELTTVVMNSSSLLNSTMTLSSTITSTVSSYTINDTSYLVTPSSTPYLNASTVYTSSTSVQLNSSSVDYQNSSYVSSSIYITSSASTPENSTIINSTHLVESTVSVFPNSTLYSSSSLVETSSPVSSTFVIETASASSVSSTSSEIMSSTLFINQTSTLQPSFETSSVIFPSSTLSSSMTYNVTSNKTVYFTSVFPSSTISPVETTVSVTGNTSSVISVFPSISTVPVVTTVNISSMISPTVMNTSLIEGISTTMTASSFMTSRSLLYNFTSSASTNSTFTVEPTTTVMETPNITMTSMVSMVTTPLVSSPTVSMTTNVTTDVQTYSLSSSVLYSTSSSVDISSSPLSSVLQTYTSVVMSTALIPSSSFSSLQSSTINTTSSAYSSLIPSSPFSSLSSRSVVTSTEFSSLIPSSSFSSLPSSTTSVVTSTAFKSLIPSSLLSSLSSSTITALPNTTSITPSSVLSYSPGTINSTSYFTPITPTITTSAYPTWSSLPSTSVSLTSVTPSITSISKSTIVTSIVESSSRFSTVISTSSYASLSSSFGFSVSTSTLSSSTVVLPSTVVSASYSPNSTLYFVTSVTSSPHPSSSVVIPTTKPNSPPTLKNDIGRIPVTAGKAFTYAIPADTFHDNEDGNTRHLNLTLFQVIEARAQVIPANFWLTFNAVNQSITGLPMEKDIPDPTNPQIGVKFLLNARDRHGAVAYDQFEILIASSSSSPYTQSLRVTLDDDFTEFNSNLTQRLDLLSKISSYYQDPDTSSIKIISYKQGSIVMTWANDSLPTNECNQEQLNAIAEKVVASNGGVNTAFKEHLSPDYTVTSAERTFSGTCIQNMTTSAPYITEKYVATEPSGLWEKHVIPGIIVVIILIILAILLICFIRRRRAKPSDLEKRTYTKRKPIILDPEMEMKPIPSKPLILENDSPLSHPPSYMSESFIYKSPSGYYDNNSGDFDEEDNRLTPPRHSPVYETPPPSYTQPEELQEPPPPPYMLPPAILYPRYDLPPWEESSEV